ncbi:unnamed protein product [Didymodactylos carnosus]|uniref:Tetratricopeptide repeat protein n=1 Tax=Didymodactylos carnosus TaxID=1234261 RepID=A0A8S2EPB2_9BILA|nr:unnamed protein product [Didymodactylos carnosus]CAF4081476.1 unnamed protein product [Didymodactylos carnosus]
MREGEILFSVPAIFRIGEMKEFDDGVWNIQLKMTADDDQQLRQLGNYVRHKFLENHEFSALFEQARTKSPEDSHVIGIHENMLKFVQLMVYIHQFDDALKIAFERWVDLVDEDTITSRQTLSVFQSFVNPVERLSKGSDIDQNRLEWIENRLNHSPPTDTNELANLYNSAASLTNNLDQRLDYCLRHFKLLEETGHMTATKFIQHHIRIGDIFSEQVRFDDALINYQIALQKALGSESTTNPLIERRIQNAWLITDQHRLSTFLHPKLKNFDYSIDEKSNAIRALKNEYDSHNLINSSPCANALDYLAENLKTCTSLSTMKKQKRKNLLLECFDLNVDVGSQASKPYQEIDDYLTLLPNDVHD